MKKFFVSIMLMINFMTIVSLAQETPNVFTYKVGSVEICLLSEGQGTGNSNIFVGATPEIIQQCLNDGSYPNSCNAFLLRLKGKNVLVDTGYGRNLIDNLKSVGVSPEQINAVLITHAHGDHIGGMLKDGQAVFANAELYLSKKEYDFCMDESDRNANARAVIDAYKSKLHTFDANTIDAKPKELFSGIRAIAALGHTPGHTMYMVESGKEKLLIWGDLTHAMAIQMPYPNVAMTYDTNCEMAIAARTKILNYVADNNIAIAGMHIAFPGIGKITKAATGGYVFTEVK